MKNAFSTIMIVSLLIGMLIPAFQIQPVSASGTIYIRADGSIDPPTAPITSTDNVTYTLVANVDVPICICRNDTIFDGSYNVIQCTGTYIQGIDLKHAENVTIKNSNIQGFKDSVSLYKSRHCTILGNNIVGSTWQGIRVQTSVDNVISGNTIVNSTLRGIYLGYYSNDNTVANNSIVNAGQYGIYLYAYSSHNIVCENEVTSSYVGICADITGSNTFYHNDFVDNADQVRLAYTRGIWDNGYPSGGNYWSDYTETYPDAEELDGSGIWDTPYVIDANNKDRYPLVNPWTPTPPAPDFSITASPTSLTVQQGNSDTSIITITAIGGFSQPVQLSVSGAPSGVTATLNAQQVTPPADGSTTSTLTVSIDETATLGSCTLTITGTSGTLTHSTYVSLEITTSGPSLPSQPINISPPDGATDVSLEPNLLGSPPLQDVDKELIPWEEMDGLWVTRVDSQWQITTAQGDYSNPVWDRTLIDGLIDRRVFPRLPDAWSGGYVHSGVLDYETTYYWRVRYEDFRDVWSPWSEETSFTTAFYPSKAELAEEVQFTVDRTISYLDRVLAEGRWSAEGGDYFAKRFEEKQIETLVDFLVGTISVAGTVVHTVEDVKDLFKVSLSGGPDTPYAHLLWLKHTLPDALFTAGEPSAITQEILRWALKYYAADLTDTAIETIGKEGLIEILKTQLKGSLALQQKFVPSLEKVVDNLKSDLANTLSEVLAEIPNLTPEEVELYRQDLPKRRQANMILLSHLERQALPLHLAQEIWEQPAWKGKITKFLFEYGLKASMGLLLDGPGLLIAGLGTLGWEAYDNTGDLTEAAEMMGLAVAATSNAFDTSKRIFLNTVRGLENIKHRVTSQIAQGEIVAINNVALGEYKDFLGRWDLFVKEAFSDVTVANTGSVNAIYELTAMYGKWGFLGTSYTPLMAQKTLRLSAGRTSVIRIHYYENGRYGGLPSEGNLITFNLLGVTDTGTYYVGGADTKFGTTRIASSEGLTISQEEIDEAQLLVYPIRLVVENSLMSPEDVLKIWVENPFNVTISANATQQIPPTITIIDADGGIIEGNTISWHLDLGPGEVKQYAVRFASQVAPGTTIEIPGAILGIYDPIDGNIGDFETDSFFFEVEFPITVRGYPPARASIGEDITVPINITNLLRHDTFTGNITLELLDFEGNSIYNLTEEISLSPEETKKIEVVATPDISPGTYVIRGILKKGDASTNVFAEYISIDASHVIGVALLEGRNNHGGSIVKLGNYTTTTNPDGSYILVSVPAGNYLLTITHLGYVSIGQEVTVGSYGFTILLQLSLAKDSIPPSTMLAIGEPKFVVDDITYLTSAIPIELIAEDNLGGSGVASTFYRIYNSSYDTGWQGYSAPFYLAGLTDAEYSIDYYSTDSAGNTEATNTTTVILESIYAVINFDPHVLNLKSKGQWFTAHIEIPANYHVGNYTASDIDLNSLRLNQTIPVDPTAPITIGDYDGNGILDLMAKFNRTAVSEFILAQGIMTGNVTLTITGKLNDGTPFEGSDIITVRMPGDADCDGSVDLSDLFIVASAFGESPGRPRWNPLADLNENNRADLVDYYIVCLNYGKTYP